MSDRSLRTRLIVASILWSLGLLTFTHLIFLLIARVHSRILTLRITHWVVLGAAACLVIAIMQVRRGLSPFRRLREHLVAVREGRERRIEGSYPAEVEPLVSDLNALLQHREEMIVRATSKAADLAHGLKTPLALLTLEADRIAARGDDAAAATVRQQVERMRRQIEYQLAGARAAGAAPVAAQTPIRTTVESLLRAMARIYADRQLAFDVRVDADATTAVARHDLDEVVGNLLDNACKWARRTVVITATPFDDAVEITVDDDGPGLAAEMRQRVLERGVRADESAPGWGLGLAIAGEVVSMYGGTLGLDEAPLGGLRACARLPR